MLSTTQISTSNAILKLSESLAKFGYRYCALFIKPDVVHRTNQLLILKLSDRKENGCTVIGWHRDSGSDIDDDHDDSDDGDSDDDGDDDSDDDVPDS